MKLVASPHEPRVTVRLVERDADAPTSDELVAALVAGQRWATDLVWELYAPMVFRLLERALGPAGEAEDVMQDVFMRVYTRVSTLQDPKALRSFVYSVAVRMLKWELRRRRVRRILTLSSTGELPEVTVQAGSAEARQLLRRFYAVLEQLSANERLAFTLRHLEGLTIKETAEALELSPATVKRRLVLAGAKVSELVSHTPGLASELQRWGASHAKS